MHGQAWISGVIGLVTAFIMGYQIGEFQQRKLWNQITDIFNQHVDSWKENPRFDKERAYADGIYDAHSWLFHQIIRKLK